MDTYLAPIEKPQGMMMGLVYKMSKRQFGKVLTPLKVVYAVMVLALFGCISIFGFVSSYARMAWKVANYNALRNEVEALRVRLAPVDRGRGAGRGSTCANSAWISGGRTRFIRS